MARYTDASEPFATLIERLIDAIYSEPPHSTQQRMNALKKLFLLILSAIIGFYSSYGFWDSSCDYGEVLAWQMKIRSPFFAKFIGGWFGLSGLFVNGLQGTEISLEQIESLLQKMTPEEYYLFRQETWREYFKAKNTAPIGVFCSAFAAAPLGYITYEEEGLVHGILVGVTNIPSSYLGVANSLEYFRALRSCQRKEKLLEIARDILTARLDQSAAEFRELTPEQRIEALDYLQRLKSDKDRRNTSNPDEISKYPKDCLAFLFNLMHCSPSNDPHYRLSDPLSYPRRLFILLMMGTVFFQIGYVLEAWLAGKAIHKIMAIISAAVSTLVYGGLTWSSTYEMARNIWSGKKTLSHLLAPTCYKLSQYALFSVGIFSGATLALTNYNTLGGFNQQGNVSSDAVFHFPQKFDIFAEIIGFISDSVSNIFFAVALIHLLIRLWMSDCSTDPLKRKLAKIDEAVNEISAIIKKMHPDHLHHVLVHVMPQQVVKQILSNNGMSNDDVVTLFGSSAGAASQRTDRNKNSGSLFQDSDNLLRGKSYTYGSVA